MDKNKNEAVEQIDLIKMFYNMLRGLRRYGWLVVCLAILGGGLWGFISWRKYVPMYRSEAIFSVSANTASSADVFGYSYYSDNTAAQQAASLFPYIIKSASMNERLMLVLDTDEIKGNISASSVANTNLFILSVTSDSPKEAYRIIQAVIDVYPQISYLLSGDTQLRIIQEPTKVTAPYNGLNLRNQLIKGGAAGAILGLLLIFIWTLILKTVQSSDDVKEFLNIAHFASVPYIRESRKSSISKTLILDTSRAYSSFTEVFRAIRLKLIRAINKSGGNIAMFTSTLQNEGKTTIAINTAITIAKEGHKVVLVDADLRNPSVKKMLNIDRKTVGFGDYLENSKFTDIGFIRHNESGLYILPSGDKRYDVNKIFKRARVEKVMDMLSKEFDYVIVDTPPCGITADTMKLCQYVNNVVYVIRQDYANRSQIYSCVQSLYDNGADVCGFVMNYATQKSGVDKYNYGYKYGYGGKYKYGYGSYGKYGKYGRYSRYSRYGRTSENASGETKTN